MPNIQQKRGSQMSSSQISAPYKRTSSPVLIVIAAVVFLLGTLTGVGLPRLLDGASYAFSAKGAPNAVQEFTGVADNNMSDAARRASLGSVRKAPFFTGVADDNMSDAALQATRH